jgi:hypothetical protein
VAFVEIFRFERAEMTLRRYGSKGVHATRIAAGDGQLHLTCLNIGPDGLLGTHPASAAQLFSSSQGKAGWPGQLAGEYRSRPAGVSAGTPGKNTPAGRTPA